MLEAGTVSLPASPSHLASIPYLDRGWHPRLLNKVTEPTSLAKAATVRPGQGPALMAASSMPLRSSIPVILGGFRLFLAYLFLSASLGGWDWSAGAFVSGKLADPILFVSSIRALELVADPWNAWIAMSLPWLEFFTGLALLLPRMALGASAMASVLLALFVSVLISASTRGLTIDCGCFGGTTGTSDAVITLFWRVIWLGMALCCLVAHWRRQNVLSESPIE